ncbi:MAG TPA: phosphatase PAP2 family protein [Planctomycetaceae bacterium]|nr:phosphatase PAP2 family protein [Planctomycetaceae bacterium]
MPTAPDSETVSADLPKRKRFVRMLDPYERLVFGGLLVVVLCGWAFIAIALNVVDGDAQLLDDRIMLTVREAVDRVGSDALGEAGRDLTALGGYTVLIMLIVGVCGYLVLVGRRQMLVFLIVSVVGAFVVMMGLKSFYQRPRPALVEHLSYVDTSSFPSGHSMMSMVVYLTFGALLARISKRKRIKIYCITFAVAISLLVGCSRVYVGVHYPTDVLAGWSGGVVWATLSCLVASWFERRGVIGLHEPAEPNEETAQ